MSEHRVTVLSLVAGFIGFLLLTSFIASCTPIGAGERGVVMRFGAVQTDGVLDEGLTFVWPFLSKVEKYTVRTQRFDIENTSAGTMDMQEVETSVTINFRISPDEVARLHQQVGPDYIRVIVERAGIETIKATCARYKAEDLIKKRREVSTEMEADFLEKLNSVEGLTNSTFVVDEFSITNFTFSSAFMSAVESKQIAEQQAAQARNEVERERARADQVIETARGKAESMLKQAAVLADNPILVQFEAIRKWDGKLPLVSGQGADFLFDFEKLQKLKTEMDKQSSSGN